MKRYKLFTVIVLSLLVSFGSLSADLATPTVGTTQVFKVFGQGFFSGYYPITATMQAENDNAYFFIEDASINDIEVNPDNPNDILLATESGVLHTLDGGVTWTHVNGEYELDAGEWDTGDMLPEDFRSGGADSEPQHRVRTTSIFYLQDDDWMAGCGLGHKTFGDTKVFGGYRTKNSGEKWSFVSRGAPANNFEGPSGYMVDARPTMYEMVDEPSDDDYFFAATESGVLMFSKSKWVTWPGAGLPQVTSEWEFMPVYDIAYDATDSMMIAATELGLYNGFVDFDEDQVSWKPVGTFGVDVLSVSTYIDSATVEYEIVTSDTAVMTFTSEVSVDDLEDGTFAVLVDGVEYTVNEVIVDASSVSLITTTITAADSLEITPISPRVYLDGTDVLTPNQWVTIVDDSNQLHWSGKARFSKGMWYVDLTEDNQYYADFNLIDPDDIEYETFLPTLANLSAIAAGDMAYSTLVETGGNIYIGSASGIYMYDGSTISMIEATEGLTINDMMANDDYIFAATNMGLYRQVGSDWIAVPPLLNDGFDGEDHEYTIDVKAVFAQNDTIYFGGDLGGLYKSTDNGDNWTTLNIGLTNRQVTLAQVDSLSNQLSPDVFSTMTTNFGSFPDIDGLDKVFVLAVDLGDLYYSSQGETGTSTPGDFLSADQAAFGDETADPNSNYRDLIYLDTNPGDISNLTAAKWAVHQLTRLILYNADTDEEEWAVAGLSGLSSFLAGKIDVSSTTYTVASKNSVTIWGDIVPLQSDYNHVFVFMEYIYEHYLTTPALLKAMVDSEENGIDGLMAAINQVDPDITFDEVLKNFILAARFDDQLDQNGAPFGGGLYDFQSLDVEMGGAAKDWGFTTGAVGDSPFVFNTVENSAVFYWSNGLIDGSYWAPGMGDQLVFNMDDASSTEVVIVLTGDMDATVTNQYLASDIQTISLDDRNYGIFDDFDDFDTPDAAGTYHRIGMLLITSSVGRVTGGAAVIHDLTTPPDYLELGVGQSASFKNNIDVYGFSDYRIYDDGAMKPFYNTDDVPQTAELEGPIVMITAAAGDTLYNTTLSHFHIDDDLGIFGYKSSFELPEGDGSYSIELSGENLWGGQVSSGTKAVEAAKVVPGIAKDLATVDGSIALHVPGSALSEATFTTLIANKVMAGSSRHMSHDVDAVSGVAHIGPYGTKLETSAQLKMKYDDLTLAAGEAINIFRRDKNGWTAIPSSMNEEDKTLQAAITEFGYYQIRKGVGERLVDTPTSFALHANYPNPFNPTTTIHYDVADASTVKLLVYNLRGQQVRTLVNQVQSPGFYSAEWNGRNGAGQEVASGIYFLRLETVDGQFNQKMIYMK